MSEVMAVSSAIVARNDALEELEKARFTADQIASMQQKTRGVQASMLCDFSQPPRARLDSLLNAGMRRKRRR